jgi:phosphonate transport system ATP-binding protein
MSGLQMDVPVENQTQTGSESRPLDYVLEGASKSYGKLAVLAGLDFQVPRGQRLAVIGPSGAGKTTLLRLLAPVIWPSAGRILAFGHDTSQLRGRRLQDVRSEIGFLYQSDNLVPGLRVVHNVLMGRLGRWILPRALLSLFWPQQLEVARMALREVELEEKLWSVPGTLSGGQQQRVAIARLLVQEPNVMLADEPVSSLDIRLGREVIQMLVRIAKERSSTLIVSLHSLDLLDENFDRIIALKQGRVFWDGAPGGLNRELLRDLYGAEYQALHLDDLRLE